MRIRGLSSRGSGGIGILILVAIVLALGHSGGGSPGPRHRLSQVTRHGPSPTHNGAHAHRPAGGPRAGRAPSGQGAGGEPARVVRVVDGDTIVADLGGDQEYVRYIGVDTPETVKPGTPVQCFGEPASHFNDALVEGRTVRLRFDRERRDRYGRLLAYVYLGPRFVNAILVRRGLARTLTIYPNDSHAGLFDRLQAEAGRAGRGLWGSCGP